MALFLFGLLAAIRAGFSQGIDVAGADRLIVIGTDRRSSSRCPSPTCERIAADPRRASDVAHATWFGGVYQDPKNFFAQFAIEPGALARGCTPSS